MGIVVLNHNNITNIAGDNPTPPNSRLWYSVYGLCI